MVAVPTIGEEDAKHPHRERENLVGERIRIINRMKAALIRWGIRGFKPELRRAPKKLDGLRTPEGLPLPPNTLEEIRRDLARLAMVRKQIDLIEQARLVRIEQAPETGHDAIIPAGRQKRGGARARNVGSTTSMTTMRPPQQGHGGLGSGGSDGLSGA